MKKLFMLMMTGVLLFVMASCSNAADQNQSSSFAGNKNISVSSNSVTLNKAAENVYLREGTTSKGSVVISSDDIVGFYTKKFKSQNSYQIVFQLTDTGKKSLAEETTKLSQSAGSVSLWVGNEMIVNLSVYAPITDGTFAVTNADADSVNNICNKLQGKTN